MGCKRSVLEEKKIEESNQEEEVVGSSESKLLGVPKVDDGIVPDRKTKLLAHHFIMPSNNASVINNLLSELISAHLGNRKLIGNENEVNLSKCLDTSSP